MSQLRVLVVEDHPQMQEAIRNLLAPCCELVGMVGDGDEVLGAAARLRPEGVVLDISLPGRSGLQLLPELRALLPEAHIVIFTTHVSDVYRREAFRLGADAYLLKGRENSPLVQLFSKAPCKPMKPGHRHQKSLPAS